MKTRRSAPSKKTTKKIPKPTPSTARYVYWYAVGHPAFGKQLLRDPSVALKKHGLALSPDEMGMLAAYLGDESTYELSGKSLLEGICTWKDHDPRKKRPLTTRLTTEARIQTEQDAAGTIKDKTPNPPPPPWG